MTELDLHGVRHHEVELLVEDFILEVQLPARIITGNSPTMKAIVWQVVAKYGCGWMYENDWNLGAIVVFEHI